jgi:uncharacterized protein (TIGR02246 family)
MTDRTALLTADEKAVRGVLTDCADAWARNDGDAFAELYTDDATVVLAGGVFLRGKEQLRWYMLSKFAGPLKGTTSIDEPETIRFVSADVAILVGMSGFRLAGETQTAPERTRRATYVLSKQDGNWKVESYTNSPVG